MTDPKVTIIPPVVGRFIPWLQTLGVAAIGAFVAASLEVALSLLRGGGGPAPWTGEGLAHMGRTGLAAAIVVALAYLRQAPAGLRKEWSEEERAAHRAKLEAQGRLGAVSPTEVQTRGEGAPPPSHGDDRGVGGLDS
jgi:hypothetical protein